MVKIKKYIGIMAFVLLLFAMEINAYAAITIEKPAIEGTYKDSHITARAYRIATKLSEGVYQFTDAFFDSGYDISDIWGSDAERISQTADGLEDFVKLQDIPYVQTKAPFGQDVVLDANTAGIYLVIVKELVSDEKVCVFQPIICVVEDKEDLKVNPKFLVREKTPEEEDEFDDDTPWDGYWDEDLPQTGIKLMGLYVLGFVGLMCIITAWGFRNGKKFIKFVKWFVGLAGVFCILSVIGLWWWNGYEEKQAIKDTKVITEDIKNVWAQKKQDYADANKRPSANENTSDEKTEITDENINQTVTENNKYTVKVNNITYNGIISIPGLGVELPVSDGCNEETLKVSPGLYFGSVNDGNMVIGAHNWKSQFRYIYNLKKGSVVSYTDINGVKYDYNVAVVTEVSPSMTEAVCTSGYELVLFTCNSTGAGRIVVYCEKV